MEVLDLCGGVRERLFGRFSQGVDRFDRVTPPGAQRDVQGPQGVVRRARLGHLLCIVGWPRRGADTTVVGQALFDRPLAAVVAEVRFRDRSFLVAELEVEGVEDPIVVSGKAGSAVAGMPVEVALAPREERPGDRQYTEEGKIVSWVCRSKEWKAFAGLEALYRLGAGHSDDQGLRMLAEARWRLENGIATGRPVLDPERLDACGRAAATLGALDLDWAVRESVLAAGADGPVLLVANPFAFLRSGRVSVDEAVRIASGSGELAPRHVAEGAVALIEREMLRSGRSWIGAKRAKGLVADAFGAELSVLDGAGLVHAQGRLVAEEAWRAGEHAVGELRRLVRSAPGPFEMKRAIGSADEWPGATEGLSVAAHLAEAPVVLVVAGAQSPGHWLGALTGALGAAGVSFALEAPDARGHLGSRWPTAEGWAAPGAGGPEVRILLDAHRMSAVRLARFFATCADGSRAIVCGDDWLWSPGAFGGLFSELVESAAFPRVVVPPAGAAGALREGVGWTRAPGVRFGEPGTRVPTVRFAEPASLRLRPGAPCMLAEDDHGFGPGTFGAIADATPGHGSVTVGAETVGVGRWGKWAGADFVPFGWLPGVATDGLWVTRPLRSYQAVYAVLSAAGAVWFEDHLLVGDLDDYRRSGIGWKALGGW